MIILEQTAENDHFFLDNRYGQPQPVYQGSALIVSLLEMHQIVEKMAIEDSKTPPPRRELAFFDKQGNFYEAVLLCDLVCDAQVNGNSAVKHTAVFEPPEAEGEMFTIPIDDIYCLSLAKPAGTLG